MSLQSFIQFFVQFIHMGGYGPYIWTAYGLTAGVYLWNILSARRLHTSAVMRARQRLIASAESQALERP